MGKIITINRQFGSGGHEIARKVAEKTGFKLYDKEIIIETAKAKGISEELVNYFDEKPIDKFGLLTTTNAIPIVNPTIPLEQQIYLAQREIMIEAAKENDCIFVGRCANYIFEDEKDLLSIFVTAPLDTRVKRKMEILKLNYNQTKKEIIKQDKKRKEYYKFYTGYNWENPLNYDYVINSGKLGIEESVESILKLIQERYD